MSTRRDFLAAAAAITTAAVTISPTPAPAQPADKKPASPPRGGAGGLLPTNAPAGPGEHYRPPYRFGLGGVAIGTGFAPISAEQSDAVMQAAWDAGVRYFDTSPWYGLGLSERRMAHFLAEQKRDDFVLSTKIGRLLTPTETIPKVMWKAPSPFDFRYDYTADGTRRSIEESLQRMGLARIDIVFIHDLSPDHFGEKWTEQFDVAARGAIPTLTKLREEGTIKAWGFGVNDVEPCLKALEVADPDIFLLATQYSIVHHNPKALEQLFPKCEKHGASIVVGAPFNSGFLAGKERYNYRPKVPPAIREKAERITAIARQHGTDLRTASLQFCNAPRAVSAVIPGASTPAQVIENAISIAGRIGPAFWQALKREKLIADNAATPA